MPFDEIRFRGFLLPQNSILARNLFELCRKNNIAAPLIQALRVIRLWRKHPPLVTGMFEFKESQTPISWQDSEPLVGKVTQVLELVNGLLIVTEEEQARHEKLPTSYEIWPIMPIGTLFSSLRRPGALSTKM
jgi:hypothetical protein